MPQPFRIKTAEVDPADLLLESFSCTERLSTLFEITASLLSPKSDLDPDLLLGKPVTFEIDEDDESTRFLNGFVTRFSQTGASGRFFRYQAIVRPWLWFLTRTTDCRIFQDQTVVEIVSSVFADSPIAVFDPKVFREYKKREYCVQYRESDFNFVSRLLEEEGIYYRFEHGDGKHTMLLLDSLSAHDPQPGGLDTLPFFGAAGQQPPAIDFISRWAMSRSIQPGKFAIADYDFVNPTGELLVDGEVQRPIANSDAELFDFPGLFRLAADGEQLLENRRDEASTRFETFAGATNAFGLQIGFTFKMTRHPRADQNSEYLVTSTNLQGSNGTLDAGSGADSSFQCDFAAMPARQQYRPLRSTQKPFVQGPQTATVVGKAGDEIHTDRFGRVRVQFRWDRLGKKDDKSSCFIRVAQFWAGKHFGAIFTPRVGHEVIVDFLEGDPDQPVITGSLYNGENLPPWKLPDNATQSGILTRSTKGGAVANANMLRFEDKKGSEVLELHAERNMSTSVEADQSTSVGHDRSADIKNHDTLTVGKGRSVTVKADGETYDVTGGRNYKVTGDEWRHVTGLHQKNVDGDLKEFAGAKRLAWTKSSYTFSSDRAFFNAGPEYYLVAFDVKAKAGGSMFFESGATVNMKATTFKVSALGDINFTANNFNRTVFQNNDTVLGPNTNTYIGAARSTVVGSATQAFMGMSNSASLALSMSSFLGIQMSNAVAISISNAVMSMTNQVAAMGITGFDLTQKGMQIENNALTLINGGGGAGAAVGNVSSGVAAAAEIASLVAGAFSLGFGATMGIAAALQGKDDIKALMDNTPMTPAVRARLQAVLDNPLSVPTTDAYGMPSTADQSAETAKLAADTPGATPAGGDPFAPPSGS